ncbi:YidB family protein [soil metagenome]
MGLLDVLTGMRNGPRGGSSGSGGMSPITMALMGLLAYKAVKGFSSSSAPASGMAAPRGGLGDLLQGGLGGAGIGGLGGILSGGLGDLLKQFQGAGKAEVADSWVGAGENKPIAPADLGKVLTSEQLEFLMQRTGLSQEQLLAGLSEQLPGAVNELTPQGRLPTADEMSRNS